MFVELCGVLAGGGKLAEAITEGTTIRTFQQMVRSAHNFLSAEKGIALSGRRAFSAAPEGLAQYWAKVEAHAGAFGSGSVLIGMAGKYDHWSCIRSMSDRSISLMDSHGIKALRRDRCTVSDPTLARHHHLSPTQTLLVSW
jgi:hypothetical protein